MKVAGKEIKDECQYCGEILQCMLFRQGHGIQQKRTNIAEMVRCQIKHMEMRCGNGKKQ